jgi:hypothetical protein
VAAICNSLYLKSFSLWRDILQWLSGGLRCIG